MVDVRIVFDAGSSRDGKLPGLAVFTNALLDQGADGISADDISNGFESLGSIYGSVVGFDSASVQLRSLTDEKLLARVLENLKRVISKPDFSTEALERQRARALVSIQAKQQSPDVLARDIFMEKLYGSHPYATPRVGTEVSVNKIRRDDIVNFHKKYYVSNNALIVIVGAVDRQRAGQIAEAITSSLETGEKAPALPEVKHLPKSERVFIEYPSTQTHILVGQPAVKYDDPDYFPLYVGNHVLGGGMTSRLFEEVREKRGLSYSVYSYFSVMRFRGPFIAGLQTKTEQVDEALNVLMNSIKDFIENGPSEEELIASKKNITGGYPLRIDSNGKILSRVADIAYYKLPLDYLEIFNQKIEAVTVEQVKDAFKRRLTPDKLVMVMVGAAEKDDKEDN